MTLWSPDYFAFWQNGLQFAYALVRHLGARYTKFAKIRHLLDRLDARIRNGGVAKVKHGDAPGHAISVTKMLQSRVCDSGLAQVEGSQVHWEPAWSPNVLRCHASF